MDNANDDNLSIYELGIIKNALRRRMVDVEEFRTDLVLEEEQEEMNEKVDAFQAELINIQHKLENIVAEKTIEI